MAELEGLSNVLRNLNAAIKQKELNLKAGLMEAALVIKADSVRETPIDLGNLRGSAFVIVTEQQPDNPSPSFSGADSGDMASNHSKAMIEGQGIVKGNVHDFSAIVGYSANYAFWVHEMPMIHKGVPRSKPSKGNYWDGGGNKFLEKSVLKNEKQVFQILEKWAKK